MYSKTDTLYIACLIFIENAREKHFNHHNLNIILFILSSGYFKTGLEGSIKLHLSPVHFAGVQYNEHFKWLCSKVNLFRKIAQTPLEYSLVE